MSNNDQIVRTLWDVIFIEKRFILRCNKLQVEPLTLERAYSFYRQSVKENR